MKGVPHRRTVVRANVSRMLIPSECEVIVGVWALWMRLSSRTHWLAARCICLNSAECSNRLQNKCWERADWVKRLHLILLIAKSIVYFGKKGSDWLGALMMFNLEVYISHFRLVIFYIVMNRIIFNHQWHSRQRVRLPILLNLHKNTLIMLTPHNHIKQPRYLDAEKLAAVTSTPR